MDNIKQFIISINKCENDDEVKKVVDTIADKLSSETKYNGEIIGLIGKGHAYNNGLYNFFITPNIRIKFDSLFSSTYHIYDRDYLYDFAKMIKKQNIDENTNPMNLSIYVGRFLEQYFKRTTDPMDYRGALLDSYSEKYAEKFYQERNIPIHNDLTAEEQMSLRGDFPITVFKGNGYAKCTEWSVLAQNLLKLVGYESACLGGEVMYNGNIEGHAYNIIRLEKDKNFLVDYSLGAPRYQNGKCIGIEPYYAILNDKEYESFIHGEKTISKEDVYYENDKRIVDHNSMRYYSVNKSIELDKQDDKGPQK